MKRLLLNLIRILSRYGWNATLVILGLLAAGFTWSSSDELYDYIKLIDRAALAINSSYVEEIDNFDLVTAGIDGMISKLDAHSKLLTGSEYLYLKQETDGEFEGIGVSLAVHHDTLTVESILEDSPAYFHGLRPGDRIVGVDGADVSGTDISDVKMKLRGPSGTSVSLRIHRPGDGELDFTLVRGKVELKAIPYFAMISSNIGYVKLMRFSDGSSRQMRSAIRELKKQNMRSLIVDLRDNPGGLLLESVKIASMFLPANTGIVETRTRGNAVSESYSSAGEPDFQSGELIVLVNSQTASAAEIVAGAIQDHDRGIIIGSTTYGKGLVQQVMQFTDDTALKLTTAKYFLPSGRCLQKPDWMKAAKSTNDERLDSLFRTDSGRLVFGGGGILPDVYIDDQLVAPFVEALIWNSCFFDYAVDFLKTHAINPDYKINDTLMADFERFLKTSGFQYRSADRISLDNFEDSLSISSDSLTFALGLIDREIARRERWQFDSNYAYISRNLRQSMIHLAYGDEAIYRIEMTPTEPGIARAIRVIADTNQYNSILATH